MDDLFQKGIAAYKAGRRDEARNIFLALVKQTPDSEYAWKWMYHVCNTDKERVHCLKQIIRINPKDEKANQLLAKFTKTDFSTKQSPQSASTVAQIISVLFIPRYNEFALFLMSGSSTLLFFIDPLLRKEVSSIFFDDFDDARAILIALLICLGIFYSFYHVFVNRKKSYWEKTAMLFSAVYINAISGVLGGIHTLKTSQAVFAIFPVWNIVNGVILLFLLRDEIINTNNIIDDNVSPFETALGSVIILVALWLCHFILNLHWAVTLSICVSYATNINWFIQYFFFEPQKK